ALANRSSYFEAIKVRNYWAGHYAYNVLDQNMILGCHPAIENLYFANGFSGHGLQQAPATGRGLSELIIYRGFRSLDLSPFSWDRVIKGQPFLERSIV
ncbi:MAG: NAD(P)/FAD-dependent oxidoreductase, partial [Saprospiraceae bacterium]